MRELRQTAVIVVIATFTLAAALGIAVLLGNGELSENHVRVLVTTVIVGLESLAVLCYLTLAGHRWAWVGVLGGVASLVWAGTSLWVTWTPWEWDVPEPWRLLWTSLVLALTFAQASLLIAVADRHGLRMVLAGTLAVAGVVAALVIGPLVFGLPEPAGYWRALGVMGIIDVLGTIVLLAIGAFGPRSYRREQIGPALRE